MEIEITWLVSKTSLMTFFMNVDDGKETKRIIHLANILEETLTPMLNLALEVTE